MNNRGDLILRGGLPESYQETLEPLSVWEYNILVNLCEALNLASYDSKCDGYLRAFHKKTCLWVFIRFADESDKLIVIRSDFIHQIISETPHIFIDLRDPNFDNSIDIFLSDCRESMKRNLPWYKK